MRRYICRKLKPEVHIVGNAQGLAQPVAQGKFKLDRLSLPLRCNPHRKYDLVVIADRRAVSVGEAMRRGIEHLGELQILRAGEIEEIGRASCRERVET